MRTSITLLIIFCTSIACAAPIIFDFGTESSPLFPKAELVTDKGGAKALWVAGAQIKAYANSVRREWVLDKHTGRDEPPACYQTELSCDYVASTAPATLQLEVPPGAYRLLLLCGRPEGRVGQVWDVTIANVDGERAQATFAEPYELRVLYLEAVTDTLGLTLSLSTRSRWLLNAIIAVPVAEWDAVKEEVITPLLKDLFLLPSEVLAKWRETPQRNSEPEPHWSDKQRLDGVALFTRPWVEPIWPDHFPRQHELNAPVRAFATRGEYEPLNFALHALRNISNVTMKISTLTTQVAGQQVEVPQSAIDVRFVRYMYVRPNYNRFNIYYRAPDVLMPWQSQGLAKGENLRIWLTVKVDAQQPPGIYTGKAALTVDGRPLEVPLTMRVLPITLERDASLAYGMYYRHPLAHFDSAPDDFSRAWWQRKAEAEHADMREHGMNTVVMRLGGSFQSGKWEFAFDKLQRDLDLARRYGFDKPFVCSIPLSALYNKYMKSGMGSHLSQVKVPPEEFFAELTQMVQMIHDEATARRWPELLYYPVDEPSTHPESVEFMTRTMAAIKRVKGVRTYVTADPAHEQFMPMRPYIDVWCCQPFSLGREAILADMQARGVEYWCYPNHISGENDHTPTIGARMTYGFGFWQSGYRCLIPWIYQFHSGDPWNYLDGRTSDFFNRVADDGSPIPVAFWEAYREGMDDHRYIHTLERLIKRARANGQSAAATRAQSVLDKILATLNVQTKYKSDGLWAPEAFDAWRWAMAEQILALQNEL